MFEKFILLGEEGKEKKVDRFCYPSILVGGPFSLQSWVLSFFILCRRV